MRPQITTFEFVRLLCALLLSIAIFFITRELAFPFIFDTGDSVGVIVYLFFVLFLPAFLCVFLASLLPSWRYKTIGATLMLSGITLLGLADVATSFEGLMPLTGSLVRLSTLMTGGLGAALIWKHWKGKHAPGGQTPSVQPAVQMPRTSPILLGLALFCIPTTYLTIFTSAFLVVGYSAFVILLLLELPSYPAYMMFVAVLAPLVAAWASIRALGVIFFSGPAFQPAQALDMAQHPLLRRLIEEVCGTVGSQAPDHVLLHAHPTFYVTQSRMRIFNPFPLHVEPRSVAGRAGPVIKGRTLAIGMPLLPHLTDQELKAILAHEFAHFSGRDTFYSVWVMPVYRSLGESITRLNAVVSQARHWIQLLVNLLLLPALYFLTLFADSFASIDAIVRRARELRADWLAATHFGSDTFTSALKKVVQYGAVVSEHQAQFDLQHIPSLYPSAEQLDPCVLQHHLDEAMQAQEREFDSHPTLRTRLESLPVHEVGGAAPSGSIHQELRDDEAVLSASYTARLMLIRDWYQHYEQAAP